MNHNATDLPPDFEGFDLKNGLRLLWSGKATILAMTIVGLGLGFLVTFMQVPIYRSHALVQIDPPSQNMSALSNPYPTTALNWFDYQNYYRTQYRLIESKALGDKVLFKLKLTEQPPFKQAKDPAAILMMTGMRRDACEATHVRHEQSSTLLDLRMSCLDRRLASHRTRRAARGG